MLQSVVLSEWRGPLRRRRRERSSPPPSRPGLHRTQGILLFLSPWWLLIMMFFVMKNKMVMVMTKKYSLNESVLCSSLIPFFPAALSFPDDDFPNKID